VQMHQKYRSKGVAFLSINVGWDKDGPAKKFIEEYKLSLPVGRDADGKIGDLYGIEAVPTTLLIGKDGRVVDRAEGAPEELKEIEDSLEKRIKGVLGT
jgi:cytochrome c biogenesis protein CcmG/thiol:disulfide interchange protein DsbE